jgi:ABC-type amino acid transport substrate-binding protein
VSHQRRLLAIAALLLLGLGLEPARAACLRPSDGVDVAIGVREAPPFIMADPIRGQRGLTFDLWESIARELGEAGLIGPTAYVECPLGDQLDALASGELDLVISPLTITAERLERLDFTHQYLSSGLTVAQRSSSAIDFGYAAGILRETVTHEGVPRAILIFLVANLVLAAVIARGLRRSADFGIVAGEALPLRLCRYAIETVVRTIGLKGIGDGGRPTPVRIVEIFMGVIGTVLSATIFGVLTTALVGSIGGSREVALAELPAQRVATLKDSTAQSFLEQLAADEAAKGLVRAATAGFDPRLDPVVQAPRSATPAAGICVDAATADAGTRCVAAGSWQEAMRLLAAGEVQLVLGDWAQLTYLARQPELAEAVSVQSSTFRLEPYGWGVSPHRPELRAAVDRALMRRVRSTEWRFVVQEYMGSGSISPD